jgi:hypothetical protein
MSGPVWWGPFGGARMSHTQIFLKLNFSYFIINAHQST